MTRRTAPDDDAPLRRLTTRPPATGSATTPASTLFVDAGAGSGKTRPRRPGHHARARRRRPAAQHRRRHVHREGRRRAARPAAGGVREGVARRTGDARRERPAQALDDLDGAAIGTLHSFAQRILTDAPDRGRAAAALEVLDEVGSSVAFDDRWAVLQTRAARRRGAWRQPLLLALAVGVKLEHLRSLARAFQSDWDLIEDHVLPRRARRRSACPTSTALVAARPARWPRGRDECTDARRQVPAATRRARRVGRATSPSATDAESRARPLLDRRRGPDVRATGRKRQLGRSPLDELRDACKAWQAEPRAAIVDELRRRLPAAARPLDRASGARSAAQRAPPTGELEFHDLLVLARDLLRDDADVRAALQAQLPAAAARRVPGHRPDPDRARRADRRRRERRRRRLARRRGPAGLAVRRRRPEAVDLPVPPRRHRARTSTRSERIGEHASASTTNFRTVRADPRLGQRGLRAADHSTSTDAPAALRALDAPPRPAAGSGPPVVVLGADAHADKPRRRPRLREREAADVAAVIRQALDERWTVVRRARPTRGAPLRLGDIAILVPARTSLPFLEDALDGGRHPLPRRGELAGLPGRGGPRPARRAPVRSPTRATCSRCVTALRSPLFGCGDDDLWRWKRDGGSFSILAPMPDERRRPTPSAQALALPAAAALRGRGG